MSFGFCPTVAKIVFLPFDDEWSRNCLIFEMCIFGDVPFSFRGLAQVLNRA